MVIATLSGLSRANLSLSGTILNPDSTAMAGVTVTLASTKAVATTNSQGIWVLDGGTTQVNTRISKPHAVSGHAVLNHGRLELNYQGRLISGRSAGSLGSKPPSLSFANGRVSTVKDTLIYSYNGKVFLRDTIAESRTGIVRFCDTNASPNHIYGWFVDSRNGRLYRSIKIGSQIWMAQNLNFVTSNSWLAWNKKDSTIKYGRWYSWAGAMGLDDSCHSKVCSSVVKPKQQGACPAGWHVPSNAEWDTLFANVGGRDSAGTKLKSSRGWLRQNGTDAFGFGLLPAGASSGSSSSGAGTDGYFCAADELSAYFSWFAYTGIGDLPNMNRGNYMKSNRYSLRCVLDD
jgi:uncharacterized protein (TIGR02145 family)